MDTVCLFLLIAFLEFLIMLLNSTQQGLPSDSFIILWKVKFKLSLNLLFEFLIVLFKSQLNFSHLVQQTFTFRLNFTQGSLTVWQGSNLLFFLHLKFLHLVHEILQGRFISLCPIDLRMIQGTTDHTGLSILQFCLQLGNHELTTWSQSRFQLLFQSFENFLSLVTIQR